MIYLIIKRDFDNLENSVANAEYSKILGYCKTEQLALNYIRDKEGKAKRYKSWDNDTYPKYEIRIVEEIK